jgi:hypothetical protein
MEENKIMMTRKDYVISAEILNQAFPENPDLILEMAQDFADYFQKDNPRFDRGRFFSAVKNSWE